MKAFVLREKLRAELSEVPEPEPETPDSLIVGVKAASMCGTDSQIYSGNIETKKLPIIMGHEGGGRIEKLGSNVRGLIEGMKVLIDPNIADGTCHLCMRGLANLCKNGGILGRDLNGVFAQRIALSSASVYQIPDSIDDKIVPLIQPLSTVHRAVARLSFDPGDVVLIIGLGATGLMFASLCKLRGAEVIGTRRTWLDQMFPVSKEFGVDHAVDLSTQDLAREVDEITKGRGADTVILAANAPEMIQKCLELVRPGGSILQFFNSNAKASYDTYMLYKKEIRLFATRSSLPFDFVSSIELVKTGKIRLEKLITGTFSLEDAATAFQENEDRKKNLKIIIEP